MNIPEDLNGIVMIGLDAEDYVHVMSYANEETTRELLLEALEILDNKEEGLANLH